jgi:hypothetical protein
LVNFYQTTRRYNPEDSHPLMGKMFQSLGIPLQTHFTAMTLMGWLSCSNENYRLFVERHAGSDKEGNGCDLFPGSVLKSV